MAEESGDPAVMVTGRIGVLPALDEPAPASSNGAATPAIAETSAVNDSIGTAQYIDRSLLAVAANPDLPDDSQPAATITGTIAGVEDWDYYAIALGAGERLVLDVDGAGINGLDAYLRVWDAAGNLVAFNDDPGAFDPGSEGQPAHNMDSAIRFIASSAGTYYFSMESYLQSSAGGYRLNVSVDTPTRLQLLDEDAAALVKGYWWDHTDLSYGFPDAPSDYPSQFYETTDGFSGFTPLQQAAAGQLLQMIANVSLLTFTENVAAPGEATIRYAMSGIPGSAHAYYPQNVGEVQPYNLAGTAWFNPSPIYSTEDTRYTEPLRGSFGWRGILHETGHTLGLKHPHDAPAVSGLHDSYEYSAMSYRSYVGQSLAGGVTNEKFGYPQTPMMLDIAALQKIYGANFAFNASDSVYSWNPATGEMAIDGVGQGAVGDGSPDSNRIFLTIWDGGGVDTYDMSNYASDATIDLRPGEWSITDAAQLAYLGDGHFARGNIANALQYEGDARSLIENAIGGSGDDLLIGNDAANKLVGGAGADRLTGGLGIDILDGGSGADIFIFTAMLDSAAATPDRILAFQSGTDLVDLLALAPVSLSWTELTDAEGILYSLVAVTLAIGDMAIRIDGLVISTDFLVDGGHDFLGNSAANLLIGSAGNDLLDGAAGADRMEGLHGHDVYHVDQAGDLVIEAMDHGDDTVLASASWTLAAGEEVETLAVADPLSIIAVDLTGNEIGQDILGNAGANILTAGGGADALYGRGGDDVYRIDGRDLVVEAEGEGYDSVHVSASWALAAGSEVESIAASDRASAGALDLTGNEYGQHILGNAGANILDGAGGADALHGFGGDDVYHVDGDDSFAEEAGQGFDKVYTSASVTLAAGAEIEFLSVEDPDAWIDIDLTGNAFDQQIFGGAGRNMLSGGGGADTLAGGDGNDFYRVDSDDVVIEAARQGFDSVYATGSFTLGAGMWVENLSAASGTAAIDLTGNELSQRLSGNEGANVLDGGGGGDELVGWGGDDTYVLHGGEIIYEDVRSGFDRIYTSANLSLFSSTEIELISVIDVAATNAIAISGNETGQRIIGNGGANVLNGRGGNDVIVAGAGDDMLDGGLDVDLLEGGAGNDIYVVDHVADVAVEQAGEGTDEIRTGLASFSLAGLVHVENLTGAAGNQALAGNDGRNVIDGGLGADAMAGGLGDDVYLVDNLGDTLTEGDGAGLDEVRTNLASYSLAGVGFVENLTGGAADQSLTGNGFNNVIDGGAGADAMAGGGGHDVYIVDNLGDTVTELDGAGVDEVRTGLGSKAPPERAVYVLPDFIENLTGTSAGAQGVRDNALSNVIVMAAGHDLIVADSGGVDTISGGAGNDFVYFGDKLTAADITNGGAGTDTISLLGNYGAGITFTAANLIGVERMALYTSLYLPGTGPNNYVITMNDANVAAGTEFFVTAASLQSNEVLTFNGAAEINGRFTIHGGAGADTITGGAGGDFVLGNGGNDTLYGLGGTDFLIGGLGADQLRGGAGSDRFVYQSTAQSAAGNVDRILDFQHADRIDLTGIDAVSGGSNDAFTFIGADAFHNVAGELRAWQNGADWFVEGDVNGDGLADLVIQVTLPDATPLGAGDFFL